MSKSTVQHFITNKNNTQNKSITREKIKKGSNSSLFLKRINLPEELQQCYKILDMRGKAPGPYRKVEHNKKTMFLDDISFMIFQQGLKENNNIFTFGTYNKILYGKHSYMGKESLKVEAEKTHGLNLLVNNEKRESIQDEAVSEFVEGRYSPVILPLGYSSKRKEQRLIYVMPVTLSYQGKSYSVKTKDFSTNGLKVFLPRMLFISGEITQLDLDFFIQQQLDLTDTSATRFFKQISYRIVDVQHINDKTYLSLIQLDLNDYAKQIFSQFINSNKVQYKFDATDILLAAKAAYVEKLYTHNLTSIALFIARQTFNPLHDKQNSSKSNSSENGYCIQNIIETKNNKAILDFFISPDSSGVDYDFSPFMLSHRALKLVELSFDNSSALLFTYWQKNKLYSLFDFEFTKKSDLAAISLKVIEHNGKVFCLNSKQVKAPEKQTLNNIVNNLLNLERDLAKDILQQTALLVAQIMLTDITEAFQKKSYFSAYIETESAPHATQNELKNEPLRLITTPVWVQNNKLNISTSQKIKQVVWQPDKLPVKVSLDVQKIRFNTRYLYTSPLILKVNDITFNAETIDFSENGIGVRLSGQAENIEVVRSGLNIFVSFLSFSKKIKEINFIDVHYKIARVIINENHLELGLVLIKEQKNSPIGHFFTQLINRNKLKLDICINDKLDYTLAHLIESYIETNINSIPLLISRDKLNGNYIKHVGMTEVACKLATSFFIKLRGYNFKILTSDDRLSAIYSKTLRGNSKFNQSFTLFTYKDTDGHGSDFLSSFTSLEGTYQQGEFHEILGKLFEKNGACIKLNFLDEMVVDSHEMEKIYNLVLSVNRQHASLLKKELADVIGLVDMVDVTLAYKAIYELHLNAVS